MSHDTIIPSSRHISHEPTAHLFIRQQTAFINVIRAHLAEFAIGALVGRNGVEELLDVVADLDDDRVPMQANAKASHERRRREVSMARMNASCSLSLIFCQVSIGGNDGIAPGICISECESLDAKPPAWGGIA